MTPAQLTTLKAAILADNTLSSQPNTADGHATVAALLNATATPAFVVWRTNVGITETGKAFVGTEWAGMTTANHTRLQTVAQWLAEGYNAGLQDIRDMFNDMWSGAGGAQTRARMLALWKRNATKGEKIFASGTGTDALPATLTIEGSISAQDVETARALP